MLCVVGCDVGVCLPAARQWYPLPCQVVPPHCHMKHATTTDVEVFTVYLLSCLNSFLLVPTLFAAGIETSYLMWGCEGAHVSSGRLLVLPGEKSPIAAGHMYTNMDLFVFVYTVWHSCGHL